LIVRAELVHSGVYVALTDSKQWLAWRVNVYEEPREFSVRQFLLLKSENGGVVTICRSSMIFNFHRGENDKNAEKNGKPISLPVKIFLKVDGEIGGNDDDPPFLLQNFFQIYLVDFSGLPGLRVRSNNIDYYNSY
jgi:hypothetical protein